MAIEIGEYVSVCLCVCVCVRVCVSEGGRKILLWRSVSEALSEDSL